MTTYDSPTAYNRFIKSEAKSNFKSLETHQVLDFLKSSEKKDNYFKNKNENNIIKMHVKVSEYKYEVFYLNLKSLKKIYKLANMRCNFHTKKISHYSISPTQKRLVFDSNASKFNANNTENGSLSKDFLANSSHTNHKNNNITFNNANSNMFIIESSAKNDHTNNTNNNGLSENYNNSNYSGIFGSSMKKIDFKALDSATAKPLDTSAISRSVISSFHLRREKKESSTKIEKISNESFYSLVELLNKRSIMYLNKKQCLKKKILLLEYKEENNKENTDTIEEAKNTEYTHNKEISKINYKADSHPSITNLNKAELSYIISKALNFYISNTITTKRNILKNSSIFNNKRNIDENNKDRKDTISKLLFFNLLKFILVLCLFYQINNLFKNNLMNFYFFYFKELNSS